MEEVKFSLSVKEHADAAEKEYANVSYFKEILYHFASNKGAVVSAVVITLIILIAVLAPVMSPYPYDEVQSQISNLPPRVPGLESLGIFNGFINGVDMYAKKNVSGQYHFFGTDNLGRDIWTRVWCGTRISLIIAFIAVFIDVFIGVIYGLISGYFGGRLDLIMQRFTEILSSIPQLVMVTLMVVVMKPGL
ncbi:MAG: ABC transporter permease, partial [Bacillota bacterium]|nr:ABC transporter permease [Bacillota bacterium]